jgi:hypothetical protein
MNAPPKRMGDRDAMDASVHDKVRFPTGAVRPNKRADYFCCSCVKITPKA